jgi:hypothetical protein
VTLLNLHGRGMFLPVFLAYANNKVYYDLMHDTVV